MTPKTPKTRVASNKLTTPAAEAALAQLSAQSLLTGKDLQRLRTIAHLLNPRTLQCSLDDSWEKLFEGLEPVNAETALRKLKQRLKEVQQEAIDDDQLAAHQSLELEVTKKSGDAPRFLWFLGPAGTTAQARTPDLEGIPAPAVQETAALPPELLGIAPSGSEPLLILTINVHETRAVREVFSPGRTPKQFLRDNSVYELLGYAGPRPVIGYRSSMGSLGVGAALFNSIKAIEHLKPAAVLGVGIAFGNKMKNQDLGDVLIATQVCNYETVRINPDGGHTPRGNQIPTSGNWVMRATQLEPNQFKLHKGLMISGEKVLDNETWLQTLFQQFPSAIGGDMEGAGLMTACHEGKVDWLVIKAVSDWGDGNKSAIGDEEKDRHQQVAARHAAEVAHAAIHLAWPTYDSLPSGQKGKHADGKVKADNVNGNTSASLSIEAKTPDFKALDALLNNQGHSHGIRQRQSQTAPDAASSLPTMAAHESLLEWLQSTEEPPVFALLGEYGMGKTITCQRLYHDLRERRAQAHPPVWAREPLYFDLRTLSLFKNRERTQTVEMPDKAALINDLIKHGWRVNPGQAVPAFNDIQALLSQGALLILDGLDECLVHLVDAQHPPFIRNLLELLTDADPDRSAGTRLLLSCRTNFFKTLDDQINFFTGQHRGKVSTQWYRSLVLQPFTETQIRQYLEQVVPDVPVDRLMELVRNTHNLSELAERPMTLKLIGGQIQELEALRARGERINGARLYELVAKSWLERDDGKHHLQPEHKMRLMPDLAAHLWRIGARSLPYDELHRWFHEWRRQQPDLAERYGPAVYNQNKLEEDLRTATFVVREDQAADRPEGFRFAHSSLLEFFLAKYLSNAVLLDQPDRWAIALPSQETLNFLGDLLEIEQHTRSRQRRVGQDPADTLNRWRKTYRAHASELLLTHALRAQDGIPSALLAGFDLRGANLRGYAFGSRNPVKGAPLLSMQSCNFAGADLRDASFLHVRLDNADFSHSMLQRTAVQHCSLRQVKLNGVQLSGTVFRHCDLHGSDMNLAASHHRCQLVACSGLEPSPMPSSYLRPPEEQLLDPRSNTHLEFFPPNVSAVHCVALSPDGKWMVSGSDDAVLRVWDTVTGEVLLALGGHNEKINCVTISPNGDRIVSGSDDNTLRVWDAASGVALFTLEGHEDEVTSVAFSPTADVIVSGSDDYTLRFWNASTGALIQAVGSGIGNHVLGLAFSRDGTRIASADCKRAPSLRDAVTGEHLMDLEECGSDVSCVRFSRDGKYIAAGSSDNAIRIWDASTGAVYLTLRGHSMGINSVDVSPDGAHIVSGSSDSTLRVWDAGTGELVRTHEGHGEYVMGVAYSPNGIQIASASRDGTLRIWDAFTDEPPIVCGHHRIQSLDFAFGGKHILKPANNGLLNLLDTETGRAQDIARNDGAGSGMCYALSRDGFRFAISTTESGILIRNTAHSDLHLVLPNHNCLVTSLTFSPGGSRIVSCSDDMLGVWDVATGTLLFSLQSDHGTLGDVLFSPDETHVTACDIKSQYILDLRTGKTLKRPARDNNNARCLAISSQGSRIAASAQNWSVRVLDVVSGQLLMCQKGKHGMVSCAEFSLDGNQLVTGSVNGVLQVWDTSSGESLLTLRDQSQEIRRVHYSSDGRHIVSQSMDGNVRQWDVSSGNCVSAYWSSPWEMAEGHAAWVPPGTETHAPGGRVISASGESWRVLSWQTWDYPGAHGRWTRLPLGSYPVVST